MVMSISCIKKKGDCFILEGKTSEPVNWYIRMAVSYREMWQIGKLVLSPANLLFLLWKTISFKSPEKIRWPEKL